MSDFIIRCPHCGGEEIRALDNVIVTTDVISWTIDAGGGLVPEFGHQETHDDTTEPVHETTPYECGDCQALFSEDDLLAARAKQVIEDAEEEEEDEVDS